MCLLEEAGAAVRVAATEMSSMAAVETHMASVYRRISNPLALSTTWYAGHSMRSHVGGTAAAAATATRTSNLLLRRAKLCFILSLALLLMRGRGRRFGSGAIASLGKKLPAGGLQPQLAAGC